jgi:hypothetical protein
MDEFKWRYRWDQLRIEAAKAAALAERERALRQECSEVGTSE